MTKDEFYLDLAFAVAKRSKCKRMQVGAVLVKDDDIIGTGYNGPPRGYQPDVCECHKTGETLEHTIHGEVNAILAAGRSGRSTKGSTLYLTMTPCARCAALIAQSGISRVVYRDEYRLNAGKELLLSLGIDVDRP